MTTAIKVENLSKKYLIKHKKESNQYETLSESLVQASKNLTNKILHPLSQGKSDRETQEEFWALKEISFEIHHGDKVGIIGRNGAGKSTLLKILSRITEPTSGRVQINGRIASLLEVGTGFHPELSGRENIYLNGAILGMSRHEIRAKFDEIVAFAEVDKFLDTPVKRYSSGMYVRLAFSVAAHLEPEILVVDEVLAVGDMAFQKKCLGKMNEVSKEGRTVIFVSHNMTAIEQLCTKGVILEGGHLIKSTSASQAINYYYQRQKTLTSDIAVNDLPRTNNSFGEKVRLIDAYYNDSDDRILSTYIMREAIKIVLKFKIIKPIAEDTHVNISFYDIQQVLITTITSRTQFGYINGNVGDTIKLEVTLNSLFLSPGEYNLSIVIGRKGHLPYDAVQNILPLTIGDKLTEQKIEHPTLPGLIQVDSTWRIK